MKAIIYKSVKNVMQSGRGRLDHWVLEYDVDIARNPDALMGWSSADGTLDQVRLRFSNLDEARGYADKQGLDYTVVVPHKRKVRPRNYGDNFRYIPAEEA